jgi:hypothetical protein
MTEAFRLSWHACGTLAVIFTEVSLAGLGKTLLHRSAYS